MTNFRLPIIVRAAQPEDASRLQRAVWPDRPLANVATLLERAQTLVKNRRGIGVVASYRGVPIGFGLLTLWPPGAEVSDLIVSAVFRGRGIGSQIVGTLSDAARDLRVDQLEIGVALSNPRALALYRRLGFRDHRLVEIDLGSGPQPVLYLVKSLLSPGYRSSSSSSSPS